VIAFGHFLQHHWLMVFGLSIYMLLIFALCLVCTRVCLAADPADMLLSNKYNSLCWRRRGDYVVPRKSN